MATWSILQGNNELMLSGRTPFDVVSVNGIGVAPIRRLTARAPFQDGDTDLGFRLDPRLVNLVLFANAASLAAAELPHLAEALPDADGPLRENQGAYRFFRIHNPYQDIASTIDAVAQPDDAIVLVGPGQSAVTTILWCFSSSARATDQLNT